VTAGAGSKAKGAIFAFAPPQVPGGEWTETEIYGFPGGTSGGHPSAPVTIGPDGDLYGTAAEGAGDHGVIFRLDHPASAGGRWKESVLYAFQGIPDGQDPTGTLVIGPGRTIFGVTRKGGQDVRGYCRRTGCGTAFELVRPASSGGAWTESLLEVSTAA